MVMKALQTRQSAGHFFYKVLPRWLCRPKAGIGIFYLQMALSGSPFTGAKTTKTLFCTCEEQNVVA